MAQQPISPEVTALITEHFGWTPLSFIDDVINAVNELLYKSVEAVDTFLCNQAPGNLGFIQPKGTIPDTDGDGNVIMSLEEEQEIQKGVHQLQTLFESAVDNAFDRFELFALRNIFYVKPELVGWFKLAHHQDADFTNITPISVQVPAQEQTQRLRHLRKHLLESHNLNRALQHQKATNEQTLSQLRTLIDTVNHPSGAPVTNPYSVLADANNTAARAHFIKMQVELLRELVHELRPLKEQLSALQNPDGDTPMIDVGNSATDARRQYIERMTRNHMEHQGLRLTARGDVIGGDFEGEGKDSEEVQRLEQIVEKLEKHSDR